MYGSAFGRWMDEIRPELKKYCVEFDYDDKLSASDIHLNNVNICKIVMSQKKLKIYGIIDEYDEGYISLCLGEDYITFEIDDSIEANLIYNKNVCITLDVIEIYDIHLW